ncbi:hypothetical protein AVEN_150636-1 [Araneus ventricosus]|uniref:Uncharacterized protein n=1 Tax=Araneus ventricosus TaxID=182803 RepID=A0A4Y2ML12_ARAVE|nr:hypothetical protein AVEN_150636-1 [Araneus ventricosus]
MSGERGGHSVRATIPDDLLLECVPNTVDTDTLCEGRCRAGTIYSGGHQRQIFRKSILRPFLFSFFPGRVTIWESCDPKQICINALFFTLPRKVSSITKLDDEQSL